jgi:hypothetical protein
MAPHRHARSATPPPRQHNADLPLSRTLARAVQRRARDSALDRSGAPVLQRKSTVDDEFTVPAAQQDGADSQSADSPIRKSLKALTGQEVFTTLKTVVARDFITSEDPSHWNFSSDFQGWFVKQTFFIPKADVVDPDSNDLGLVGGVHTWRADPVVAFQIVTTEEASTYVPKTRTTYVRKLITGSGPIKARGEAPILKPGLEGIEAAAEAAIAQLYTDYIGNAARQWKAGPPANEPGRADTPPAATPNGTSDKISLSALRARS